MKKIWLCVSSIFSAIYAKDIYFGDECILKDTGKTSLCFPPYKCAYAKDESNSHKTFQYCQNDTFYSLLCCPMEKSELKCLTYYKQSDLALFISHGKKTLAGEFPHMAAVGYGEKNTAQWLCGGSLISEQFVLTAAHCINPKKTGPARWVRLGDLDLQDMKDVPKPQEFAIAEAVVHPEYKSPSHYHDIALIKLDHPAVFNNFVKPACLHVEKSIPHTLTVTGWGKIDIFGERSNHLLKADLNHVAQNVCQKQYASISKKKLANGIREDIQLCAGHPEGRDTCPGDSGGPLQYKKSAIPDYFIIIGVTSFGKACGLENSIGVYTRVFPYTRWIENIVWPEERTQETIII